MRWDPLLHEQWGLKQAVGILALGAVGLSALRLPESVPAPKNLGMHISCKGGQSYASTAVLRSPGFFFISAIRSDIGGARRLWVDIQLEDCRTLHWVILTMPTSASDRNLEWVNELGKLSDDISTLISHCPPDEDLLLLGSGGMNFQPDELGGGKEPARKRAGVGEVVLYLWSRAPEPSLR